jgi:uncharacterized membrane protein YedE/YeeE
MEQFYTTDIVSDSAKAAIGASLIGLVFGLFSQRSQFCLRAATIEVWRGKPGEKLTIWLLAFAAALLSVQLLVQLELIPLENVRQLTSVGSLSGALIGGALFGSGMVLARGCASRILVLSATGNLRALITGLLLTVVAQSSLRGILSPLREQLSNLWLITPGDRSLAYYLPEYFGIILGASLLTLALIMVVRSNIGVFKPIAAVIVGLSVAAGWLFTAQLSAASFDTVAIESITFTGPSANTLMALINEPNLPLSFGIGLVPGVFVGSFIASILSGTFKIERFSVETGMGRYITGAVMMGFGGMLAGGCAVGAGLTGVSVFSLTALVALSSMWVSAGLTDMILDRKQSFSISILAKWPFSKSVA